MRIILASQSPRRRELMRMLNIPYEAIVSDVEEDVPEQIAPGELVEALALQKARAVFAQHPEACVIGADTVVYIDGEILGKPRDDADAAGILRRLRGRTHEVYTGVAVLAPTGEEVDRDVTRVTFAPMTEREIAWYVKTGEPRDKAGAYGIQGPGGIFIDRVEGNYFTVIGMPLPLLYRMLARAGALAL
ncbi:MAG TPA: Maf family protein [Feifaniaceae bacterium]|nr:Maf family protein [Feifaniaceae bacterium]